MGCTSSKPDIAASSSAANTAGNPNWHSGISRLTEHHKHDRDIFLNEIRAAVPSIKYMPYKSHGPIVELTEQNNGVCFGLAVLFLLYFASNEAHARDNKRNRRWSTFAIDIQGRRNANGDLYLNKDIQKLIKDYHKSQDCVHALESAPEKILALPPDVLTEEGQQLVAEHEKYEYIKMTDSPPKMVHPETHATMTWKEWEEEHGRLYNEHRLQPTIPLPAQKFVQLVYHGSRHFCNRKVDLYDALGAYIMEQLNEISYFVMSIPGHAVTAIQKGDEFYFFDSNVGTFAMNGQQNATVFLRSFFQSNQIWPAYRRANWVNAYKEGDTNLQATQPTFKVVRFIPYNNDADFGGRTPGTRPRELSELQDRITDMNSSCCVYKSEEEVQVENLISAVTD